MRLSLVVRPCVPGIIPGRIVGFLHLDPLDRKKKAAKPHAGPQGFLRIFIHRINYMSMSIALPVDRSVTAVTPYHHFMCSNSIWFRPLG